MVGPTSEFDAILELCRDRHRRIVLAVLAHENRSVTVSDLTEAIIKHNHHEPPSAVPEEKTTQIQLSLQHTHLPKVAELGFVEYDRERQLVEPTPQFGRLEPQLSAMVESDPGLDPPLTR